MWNKCIYICKQDTTLIYVINEYSWDEIKGGEGETMTLILVLPLKMKFVTRMLKHKITYYGQMFHTKLLLKL